MATVDVTDAREQRNDGTGLDPEVARAASDADADPTHADEVARLELVKRHLLKDIAVKDAYLAALRGELRDKDRELVALRGELEALHGRIERTLAQPRYRFVDAVNRTLHRFGRVHRLLKRVLAPARSEPPHERALPRS